MLTNSQMKPSRFERFQIARRKLAWIKARLSEGYTVQITTYTKSTRYTAKHVDMFKATKTGLYTQRGKAWDCIDGANIKAF